MSPGRCVCCLLDDTCLTIQVPAGFEARIILDPHGRINLEIKQQRSVVVLMKKVGKVLLWIALAALRLSPLLLK